MSSSPAREPLTGVLRQDNIIVGAICLPDECPEEFIEQFNHCYGSLGLRIETPAGLAAPKSNRPVGA